MRWESSAGVEGMSRLGAGGVEERDVAWEYLLSWVEIWSIEEIDNACHQDAGKLVSLGSWGGGRKAWGDNEESTIP